MLARILLVLNALMLTIFGGAWLLVWWLWRPFPLWCVVPLWLLTHLTVHFLSTLRMFRDSERFRSPRPPEAALTGAQWWRLIVAEWWCAVRLFSWLFPLERLYRPALNRNPQHLRGLPVLMLHGYVCNGAYWKSMARHLRAEGLGPCYTMNLEPTFGSISHAAERVASACARIRRETGAPGVVLLGHSMGGLVARAAVLRYGAGADVRAVMCLGTPHHGTVFAKKGYGANSAEMRVKSPWLEALNAETWPAEIPLVSLWSYHDNIVAPQASSQLAGAENETVTGIGHLELAWNPQVQRRVAERLAAFAQ